MHQDTEKLIKRKSEFVYTWNFTTFGIRALTLLAVFLFLLLFKLLLLLFLLSLCHCSRETIVFLLLLLVVGLHDCWHLYGLVTASFWIPAVLVLFPFSFCIPLLMWLELPFFKEGKREDSTIAGLHSGFKDNLQLDK